MKNIVIIMAGGNGSRLGATVPKQYLCLNRHGNRRRNILSYGLEAFLDSPHIDGIVVVIGKLHQRLYEDTVLQIRNNRHMDKLLGYCFGGESRSSSVHNGLKYIHAMDMCQHGNSNGNGNPDNIRVLIHDGARPFIEADLIHEIVENLKHNDALLVGLEVVDTLQYVEGGTVLKTVDRRNIWRSQTPQGFNYRMLLEAYNHISRYEDYTDDVSVWIDYHRDKGVKIIRGREELFKITVERDLQRAQNYIEYRDRSRENTEAEEEQVK